MVIDFAKKKKETVNIDDFIREFIVTGELNYRISFYVRNKNDIEDISQTIILKLLEVKFFEKLNYSNRKGISNYIGKTISNLIKYYYFTESRWNRWLKSKYRVFTYREFDTTQMDRTEERCNIPEEFLSYYDELVSGGNVYTAFKDSGRPLYWGYRVRDELKKVVNS